MLSPAEDLGRREAHADTGAHAAKIEAVKACVVIAHRRRAELLTHRTRSAGVQAVTSSDAASSAHAIRGVVRCRVGREVMEEIMRELMAYSAEARREAARWR